MRRDLTSIRHVYVSHCYQTENNKQNKKAHTHEHTHLVRKFYRRIKNACLARCQVPVANFTQCSQHRHVRARACNTLFRSTTFDIYNRMKCSVFYSYSHYMLSSTALHIFVFFSSQQHVAIQNTSARAHIARISLNPACEYYLTIIFHCILQLDFGIAALSYTLATS